MKLQPQITFRGMEPSPAVEAKIRERIAGLERFHDRIMSCRVVVEAPHRHKHKGKGYTVHVDLTIPNGEIVASRDPGRNHAHEDIYVAVRDAFNAVARQLEDHVRVHSGHRAKPHPEIAHGTVARINHDDGFGFITTMDDREVYFHRNSVTSGDWNAIEAGTAVRFTESTGEKGAHAMTVTPIEARRSSKAE